MEIRMEKKMNGKEMKREKTNILKRKKIKIKEFVHLMNIQILTFNYRH